MTYFSEQIEERINELEDMLFEHQSEILTLENEIYNLERELAVALQEEQGYQEFDAELTGDAEW